jgi:hypothetical protein
MQKHPDAGRKKGTPNKETEEVRRLAKVHGPHAITKLRTLMDEAKDERAQVAAAKELLERAYGRSSQTLGIDPTANQIKVVLQGDDTKL